MWSNRRREPILAVLSLGSRDVLGRYRCLPEAFCGQRALQFASQRLNHLSQDVLDLECVQHQLSSFLSNRFEQLFPLILQIKPFHSTYSDVLLTIKMDGIPAKPLPMTAENVLKKRKRTAQSLSSNFRRRQPQPTTSRINFKKAEDFIKEHRKKLRDEKRLKKLTTSEVSSPNEGTAAEKTSVLVIRIVGTKGLSTRTQKILKVLRLRQMNSAVLMTLNKATLALLRLVEPYITWGRPNLKTVRDLIFKKGMARIDGRKLPLNDNSRIEKHLGHIDILCLEDLVHELFTIGPNFKYAANFVWPFKLNPAGGWKNSSIPFSAGGDYGDREEKINALIRKMI